MTSTRDGRFPTNGIFDLLGVDRRLNLAESTARDLRLDELLSLVPPERLAGLKLGYGSSQGLPALRAAISHKTGVPPDRVLVTQGAAMGMALLALELFRSESEAVVFRPCFPPTRDVLRGVGASVNDIHLAFDQGYRIDLERFATALSPQVALVSLASPQSPSGVRVDQNTVRAMLALMAEKAPDAILLVDETYAASAYGDGAPTSFAALDERIVTASSVSKAHGAPGLRIGWLTVPDPNLLDRLIVAKNNLSLSCSVLAETLAEALLESEEDVLRPRRRLLREALERVAAWREREADRLEWVRPEGGALCVMRLRRERFNDEDVEAFWSALPAHELQLGEGVWFGEDRGTFRLGFGYLSLEALEEGLAAISAVMDEITLAEASVDRGKAEDHRTRHGGGQC